MAPSAVLARGSRIYYQTHQDTFGGEVRAVDMYVPLETDESYAQCIGVLRAVTGMYDAAGWSVPSGKQASWPSHAKSSWHGIKTAGHDVVGQMGRGKLRGVDEKALAAAWSKMLSSPAGPQKRTPHMERVEAVPAMGRDSGRLQRRRAAEQRRAHARAKGHAMYEPESVL